jgi:hypothetical protein
MTLFQRLLGIGCISLAVSHGVASDHANENLPINKTKRSLRDWFDPTSATEKVLTEDPFSLPTSTHYTQWVPFESGLRSTNNRFYLALDSLMQGKTDRIFRYAVKLVTRSGVENIRFEGLSCEYKAYRVYAFGNPDGTWIKASQPKWHDIVRNIHNDYAAALFDVFCRTTGQHSIEKIQKQFKSNATYDLAPS